MSTKMKILIGVNLVLLTAILLSLRSESPSGTMEGDPTRFALLDTASVVEIAAHESLFEKRGARSWRLDKQYDAQPNMVRSMLAVLSRIEVKRPAPESITPTLATQYSQSPVRINITLEDGTQRDFTLLEGSGNISYASSDGETFYEVYIPGYDVDLYSFFEVDQRVWRDRRVLLTDWRNLKNLEVQYTGDAKNSFSIRFDSVFFRIEGVQKLDSAKVFAYIQQFQDFNVMRFAPEEAAFKNTLQASDPFLTINLENMVSATDNTLRLYPSQSDTIYAISARTDELVLVDRRMLNRFLVARSEFEKQ